MIRIKSIDEPFTTPRLAAKAASIVARAEAMGLLGDRESVLTLDADTFGRLAKRMNRFGIGAGLVQGHLLGLLGEGGEHGPGSVARLHGRRQDMPMVATESDYVNQYLDRFTEALEASPIPACEWKQLVRVLGVDLLERLLGISGMSIRRYAAATRQTPDDVAARLHWLALVVGDLAGAYNEIGIRQWFNRKRAQLDGRAPAQVLGATWKPDDPRVQRVRDLAHALVGSPAT